MSTDKPRHAQVEQYDLTKQSTCNQSEHKALDLVRQAAELPKELPQNFEAEKSDHTIAAIKFNKFRREEQPSWLEQIYRQRDQTKSSLDKPKAPQRTDVIDGRDVVIIGRDKEYAQFNHQQGDNRYGYQGDCGLVSCQDILNQFGIRVNENDVVGFASKHGLCDTTGEANSRGGTTVQNQQEILKDYHIPAHYETEKKMSDLASYIAQDKGVIIEVNAGVLWNDSRYLDNGDSNHAIVATGVALDSQKNIVGFFINDSGANNSDRFVDVETMKKAWEKPGGACVVTDITHDTIVQRLQKRSSLPAEPYKDASIRPLTAITVEA